jgi:peptidoglycan-N-acetylglucosamine deacetylase
MTNTKPIVSISLDLDNKWSYMKTHGDKSWEDYPTYLDIVIPHVLDILDQLKLKITFFVVGQDAALDKNEEYLRALVERGHEISNHSFNHEPWLQKYSKDQITDDVMGAEREITRVTGQKPLGFRGPGFTWSPSLFEVLAENGYIYDASTLPTYIGPLARAYYFWRTDFNGNEKKQRNELFGGLRDGFRSVKPYLWRLDSGRTLLEIPVTTIPVMKIPFHLSYLIYLSQFSLKLMITYLKTAIALCRATGSGISFLLHPLDFLDAKQVPELAFFPGMNMEKEQKMQLFVMVVDMLARHFSLKNMSSYARSYLMKNSLRVDNP